MSSRSSTFKSTARAQDEDVTRDQAPRLRRRLRGANRRAGGPDRVLNLDEEGKNN